MNYNIFEMDEKIMIVSSDKNETNIHSHNFYELVYVVQGTAVQNINGTDIEIKEGDYYILDFNTVHNYKNCKNFKVINCLFKPEFIDKALKGCVDFGVRRTINLIHFDYTILSKIPENNIFHDDSNIKALFESMLSEYSVKKGGYIELIRCYLIQILVVSLRSIYVPQTDKISKTTYDIISFTEEHFNENITLSHICKNINFTLPYISKKFKEETGTSFQKYLQNLRIEQSMRLLSETDKKITEIAHDVGYNDIKFFGELFKKNIGMSPRKFRLKIKNE